MRPLRVCIDARIESGVYGGVEQVTIGLAGALARLEAGDEEYVFLTHRGKDEWLRPYLGDHARVLHVGEPPAWPSWKFRIRSALGGRVPFVEPPLRPPDPVPDVWASEGTIEVAGMDVVHFPNQMAFLTEVPSIYHPHDLQHLHLPELFEPRFIELRETFYRGYCEQASVVVMLTEWGKRDIVERYRLPPEKVAVVGAGSALREYPAPSERDLDKLRASLSLPERFLLYPGQTWPHKNHERLLEAIALLKDREGISVPVVCPGQHHPDHFPLVAARARRLGIDGLVSFPGFISVTALRGLYELCRGLVFPSRFEGFGLPLCEAFEAGVPVASSTATCLPEVAGDAALMFDPDDTPAIGEAIRTLWTDEPVREDLIARGRLRAQIYSWDRSARIFRAHYRRVGNRPLTGDDRELLGRSL
jgi:glycosyltransferase involved in cell wall biosynthesis